MGLFSVMKRSRSPEHYTNDTQTGNQVSCSDKSINKIHGMKTHFCNVSECKSKFTTKQLLALHVKSVHSEKICVCDVDECQFRSATKGMMATHRKRVHGKKAYICNIDECEYRCTTQGILNYHVKAVHGKKRYTCTIDKCEYQCSTRAFLNNHVKTVHDETKTYCCNYDNCKFRTSSSNDMKKHWNMHIGKKEHVCNYELCESKFVRRSALKNHIQSCHSKEALLRRKKQEERISKGLTENDIKFEREIRVTFDCLNIEKKFAQIDFVIYTEKRLVLLSVDEHQHRPSSKENNNGDGRFQYTVFCDMARMSRVWSAHVSASGANGVQPILWLRYNPNAFYIDGINKSRRLPRKDREPKLVDAIQNYDIGEKQLTIVYLYYGCNTDDKGNLKPCILDHSDYSIPLMEAVEAPIMD